MFFSFSHLVGAGLSKFSISWDSGISGEMFPSLSILRIVQFWFYIKFGVQEFTGWLKQTNHMPAPGGKGQSEKCWEMCNKVRTFTAAAAETLTAQVKHSLY